MTHVLVMVDDGEIHSICWFRDERPARELLLAVNVGRLVAAHRVLAPDAVQSACYLPEWDLLLVAPAAPLVAMTPRLYETLWHLADDKDGARSAQAMQLSRRMVYEHYARLKERFGVDTNAEVLTLAHVYGML